MNVAIVAKALRDRRRAIIGNSVGLVALIAWLGVLFPILRGSDAFIEMIERFPPELAAVFGMDPATFLTAAGYLSTQLYALFAPLLILIFVINAATSDVTAEERDGLMDMLLSVPLSRSRVFAAKAGGVALSTLALVAVMTGALLIVNPVFDMALPVVAVLASGAGLWLLGVLFGSIALLVGTVAGRTTVAGGVTGLVAVVAWFVNGFAGLYSWLEGPSVFSPFTWYLEPNPLIEGFTTGHLWLVVTTLIIALAATFLFTRRDIASERVVLPDAALVRTRRFRKRSSGRPRAAWLLTGLLRKTVWDRRRAVWAWGGGLGLLTVAMFSAWPALAQDADALAALITSMPREVFAMFGMSDPAAIVTPAGFISSRIYQTIGPILVIMFAVRGVSMGLTKEESSGVLDLVLANPASRTKVVATKASGIVLTTVLVVLIPTVVAIAGDLAWETNLGPGRIVAASAGLGLLGLFFAGLAMAIWALGGASFPAIRTTAVVALATFFLNGLGSLTDTLEPARVISPFYWYFGDTPPLAKGFEPTYFLLLAGAAVTGWLAITRFERRDVAV
ncbi:MAG: ABC transporter permease subunit [bacterium]|nr:ABC transporter permease subunit [bacterium]MDE0440050.1 ABC transporter permease subunit [bacterium]